MAPSKQEHLQELRRLDKPPNDKQSYVVPQLGGKVLTIPGTKTVFRIVTSELQDENGIAVVQYDGALGDPPGFHHHEMAHDVFLPTKGYLKLWVGDKCKILGPGDFAYVPPRIVHNPQLVAPTTQTFGLISPASWLEFFYYIADQYDGILYPEFDDRDFKANVLQKMSAAEGKYDVHFHPDYVGADVSEWDADDEKLPDGNVPFYLKANSGPRWMLGGVMSRPFVTTKQTAGRFAVSSIESSSHYGASVFEKKMTFPSTHHCLSVIDGVLEVTLEGLAPCVLSAGESVFIAAGTPFALKFASKFVRVWSFASGDGIEAVIHEAGKPWKGFALPDSVGPVDEGAVRKAHEKIGARL